MMYLMDTHDRTKGSFPAHEVTEEEFIRTYAGFEKACEEEGGTDLGAHVNVREGMAFCFTK